MIRRLQLFLIGCGVLFAGLALAQEPAAEPDEPPVRLKKKNKADVPEPGKLPGAEDKKPEKPKAGDAKEGADARSDATFEVYKDRAGEYRWRLRTTNKQIIATSGEGYKEKRDCLAGVESVKRNAAAAKVEEQAAQ